MRSFTPRTEDFDQTLTDLLASPYIRYRGQIKYQTVEEVVGRVALYEGRTPELAAKVMLDTALLRKVGEEPNEAARQELIHDEIVKRAAEVEQQLQEARGREQTEREARRLAEEQATEAAQKVADAEQRAAEHARKAAEERRLRLAAERRAERETEDVRTGANRERERTQGELEELKQTVTGHAAELAKLRGREANRRKWMKRGLALLIGVLGALMAAAPIAFDRVSKPWPRALVIGTGLLVIFLAARLVTDWRRVWIAVAGFGVVLGIFAGLHELFA